MSNPEDRAARVAQTAKDISENMDKSDALERILKRARADGVDEERVAVEFEFFQDYVSGVIGTLKENDNLTEAIMGALLTIQNTGGIKPKEMIPAMIAAMSFTIIHQMDEMIGQDFSDGKDLRKSSDPEAVQATEACTFWRNYAPKIFSDVFEQTARAMAEMPEKMVPNISNRVQNGMILFTAVQRCLSWHTKAFPEIEAARARVKRTKPLLNRMLTTPTNNDDLNEILGELRKITRT